jgi:hypothetical protein
MKRVFHHYKLWEDYKHGFYNVPSKKEKNKDKDKVLDFFTDQDLVFAQMFKVSNSWVYSMEQNLTNINMNRVAYIGQASVCYFLGISSLSTMYAWKFLKPDDQIKSNKTANKIIKLWEQKRIYINTFKSGNQEVMKEGCQMKLLVS